MYQQLCSTIRGLVLPAILCIAALGGGSASAQCGSLGYFPYQFDGFIGTRRAIILFNGEYYKASNTGVAKLVGDAWELVLPGPYYTLHVSDGMLLAGTIAGILSTENGTDWETFAVGEVVYAMAEFNGDLIVAGGFTSIEGTPANNIARWDGQQWHPLGPGTGADSGYIYTLAVYNGELIAGGNFTVAEGAPGNRVARWDGSAWAALGDGIGDGEVRALAAHNGKLVIGGQFSQAGGFLLVNNIVQWDGAAWIPMQGGLDDQVYTLAVYGGDVYAGGEFVSADGNPAVCVARWSEDAEQFGWYAVGNIHSGTVFALRVIGNALMVVGGYSVTDSDVRNIATWQAGVPAFIEHPVHTQAMEGDDVTLTASVGEVEAPAWAFAWRRDGEWITGGISEPTLTLANVSQADLGSYDVVVFNACGINYSRPAVLIVTTEPTCPADLNGDSFVSTVDLLTVLSAWGSCP